MRIQLFAVVAAALLAPLGMVGCDRTVAEKSTETRDTNGNVTRETKSVTQDPAGNVTVKKETVVNK